MSQYGRSRQEYYEDEFQQDYYNSATYPVEQLPYPEAAAAHLYQQNAMLAQLGQAHGNGMPQYAQEDMRYYDQMQQNGFKNAAQRAYYQPSQSTHVGADQRRRNRQDARDDGRYSELYQEGYAPQSRTTISGTRTSTERTRGTPVQTSSSRQTASSRSTSFESSSSSSSFESEDWEDNIMSALNDMAGNLKKIGGIRCNQAGPDTTELQVQLNLPLPIEGFNNALATLSPKKCSNMQYDYSHLETNVMEMEEKFLGTMDQIQGNMMPVYKSLFESQSESSDEVDDDESQSTYEDKRFLPKVQQQQQQRQRLQQQYQNTNVIASPSRAQNIAGIPTQIMISNQPSAVSSVDSWNMLSPRDETHRNPTNAVNTVDNNIDSANKRGRGEQRVPASKQTLEVENLEKRQTRKKPKAKQRDLQSNDEIPQVINVDEGNVNQSYSDLTVGVRKSAQNAEKSTSNVPAIKTQFSGDEIMGHSKASFQRNSTKKGNFNPDSNDQTGKEAAIVKSDPPPTSTRSHKTNKFKNDLADNDLDEEQRFEQERENAKKLEEERKQLEAEAKAKEKALGKKRLEEKVEAELEAARKALRLKKLEAQRKQREAEAKIAEQKALEEKRLMEESKKLEAEAKAAEEAERLEAERQRVVAEVKAERDALEAKRLEEERKRREAEEKVAEEARKAKDLEEERRRIEAETKAAQEALEALYAKKADEEKRQREAASKAEKERKQRAAEAKVREVRRLKEVRERVEAEAKAAEEEANELERESKRIEAETKAVEKTLEKKKTSESVRTSRKVEKERKRNEAGKSVHREEKGRASLYKVQGFDDYCKSVASFHVDSDGRVEDVDSSDEDTMSVGEQSDVYSSSYGSHSGDSYSSDEESDQFSDSTSRAEDSDEVRSASSTERLRNNAHVDHPFSSGKSVNTMDRTVQSFRTKDTSRESTGPAKSFSKSKLTKPSKYSDVPIPIAATLSTLPTQTFDQGTVVSEQHSLGRFIKSSDERSVISSTSYSNQSVISAKPVALPVTPLPRETKKKKKTVPLGRSSIVGTILSFALKLALRITFTVMIFLYTWMKHLVLSIGKKQAAKLEASPTKFALQPGQAIRREEIQERVADNRIQQNAVQHYLGHENKDQEHYATTMIIKPPGYLADDSDEVGTCVESIVPDTHYPNMSDGKMSTWKITQKNTETSSLTSPPSASFGVLKSAYSALSSTRREEKSNWLDHATIDDEMSYYE